jgi:hypothetical protein
MWTNVFEGDADSLRDTDFVDCSADLMLMHTFLGEPVVIGKYRGPQWAYEQARNNHLFDKKKGKLFFNGFFSSAINSRKSSPVDGATAAQTLGQCNKPIEKPIKCVSALYDARQAS